MTMDAGDADLPAGLHQESAEVSARRRRPTAAMAASRQDKVATDDPVLPRVALSGLCAALALAAASARDAQEPFYKGKRLTVLINFAAGGPTDIEGRHLREISGPAHRRRAQPRGAEHGRRRRPDRRAVSRRDRAQGRHRARRISPARPGSTPAIRSAGASISAATSSSRASLRPRSISCAPTCRPASRRRRTSSRRRG